MNNISIHYRSGTTQDLPAINDVVKLAIMSWPLSERVKKLSLKVLTYDYTDLAYYRCYVALANQKIVAVIIWDPDQTEMLCHGLYVAPEFQAIGLGKKLLGHFYEAAKDDGCQAILVKAERVSCEYFKKLGYNPVPASATNDYPYLFRKVLTQQ